MEPIALSRFGLETSDNARRVLMGQGIVPVCAKNSKHVIGFALSMDQGARLLGRKCWSGNHYKNIQKFLNDGRVASGSGMAQWRTITVNDRPEFIFMNTAMIRRYWHEVQALVCGRHSRMIAMHTGQDLWLQTQLLSGAFRYIHMTYQQPMPHIQGSHMMISASHGDVKREVDRFGRAVIISHKHTHVKAYIAPLSMRADLEALGVTITGSRTLEAMKKAKNYTLPPNTAELVKRATPLGHEDNFKDQYLLVSADVTQQVKDRFLADYPKDASFPFEQTEADFDQLQRHTVYAKTHISMASLLSRLIMKATQNQSILSVMIDSHFAPPQFLSVIGNAPLCERVMQMPIADSHQFIRSRHVVMGKSISWIVNNQNWLVGGDNLANGIAGTATERRVNETLQATFASFAKPSQCNLLIVNPQTGCPSGVGVTNCPQIASAARRLNRLNRNGITYV